MKSVSKKGANGHSLKNLKISQTLYSNNEKLKKK